MKKSRPVHAVKLATMTVTALGAALLATFAAGGHARAQSADTCAPACAQGQVCVQGTCMVPAAPPPPASAAPNYYPAPPAQPGPYQTAQGNAYPPPGNYPPPGYPPPQGSPYPPPPPSAYPPSYPPSYPPAGSYPPPPPPPPPRRSGLLVLPFIGLNSYAGDSGNGLGVGLRLGTLLGGRIGESFSVNGELLFDILNPENTDGQDVSLVDIGFTFSPLFHVPRGNMELVIGPKLGVWIESGRYSSGGLTDKSSANGTDFGLNAGLFTTINGSIGIGGLLAFDVRSFQKQCGTLAGQPEVCATDNLPDADKVFGFNFALLF